MNVTEYSARRHILRRELLAKRITLKEYHERKAALKNDLLNRKDKR